jgi:translation elongation factor EF-1alpha
MRRRFDEVVGKLSPFLKVTGFNPKTDLTFIPVSAYTGANVKDKVDASVCTWYSGPSLLGFLDGMPLHDRKNNAPLLMPISEKYNDMGTIVVGKIESGRIRKGANLMLMPNKVRGQRSSCTRVCVINHRTDARRSHPYRERERDGRGDEGGAERRQRQGPVAWRQR